jgi:hypothetical protein
MTTQDDILKLLLQQAKLQQEAVQLLLNQAPGDYATIQLSNMNLAKLKEGLFKALETDAGPPPVDGGDASLVGLGPDAAPTLGTAFKPIDVKPYDDEVPSARLIAMADLYYCYQHERLGMFRAVQKLQELFRAGTLRLEDGAGAFGLYRFDRKSTLRYTRDQRMQAYRRVFGYTNATPPPGARANSAFHRHLQGFCTQIAQLYRDRRIAETFRGPAATPDATFGSVAAARRAGLDFRSNLKQAAFGDVSVLTVELMQLLRQAVEILGAEDVLRQFGADNAWDALEEVLRRYLSEEPQSSQRSRMGITGREIIRWLAQPFVLVTSRAEFEALAEPVSEAAEEWLTSAQSVGLLTRQAPPLTQNVVPFRRVAT